MNTNTSSLTRYIFTHSFTHKCTCLLTCICALFTLSALTSQDALAQACNGSDNVSFIWTSPPKLDIQDSDSARWGTDAGIRFAYTGDWCPLPEDVSFEDEDGNQIPATIYFNVPTTIVENLEVPPQIGLVKPLMSLELSTDYTLVLSPPNPALALYQDYTLSFRTARAPVEVDYDEFAGVSEVGIDGNLCEGEGLYPGNVDDPSCGVPSFMTLKLSFDALPIHEVSYLVYRASSTPTNSGAGVEFSDDVSRPLAYVPGVSAERAMRPIEVTLNVPYAPFPREECFKVVAIDSWGRERGGVDVIDCITLSNPKSCPEVQLPTPNPSEFAPPLDGIACDPIGINGATGRTPIPPLEEPMEEMMEEEMEEEEEPMEEAAAEDEGCEQRSSDAGIWWLVALLFVCGFSTRRARTLRAR